MKYVCTWEHDFENLLTQNKEVAAFIVSLVLQERLDPRDSFFGGRTNAVKLYYCSGRGEMIHYLDFCSLYPSVNKYARYPVKEPKIIIRNFFRHQRLLWNCQDQDITPQKVVPPSVATKKSMEN